MSVQKFLKSEDNMGRYDHRCHNSILVKTKENLIACCSSVSPPPKERVPHTHGQINLIEQKLNTIRGRQLTCTDEINGFQKRLTSVHGTGTKRLMRYSAKVLHFVILTLFAGFNESTCNVSPECAVNQSTFPMLETIKIWSRWSGDQ